MLVLLETSQLPIGWLKSAAALNISCARMSSGGSGARGARDGTTRGGAASAGCGARHRGDRRGRRRAGCEVWRRTRMVVLLETSQLPIGWLNFLAALNIVCAHTGGGGIRGARGARDGHGAGQGMHARGGGGSSTRT